MGSRVPARLMTAAEGRKFGFTVGLAFTAIGLFVLWRQKQPQATILLSLGGALIAAALVIPTKLGPVERAWMGLAHLISKVTTPIFMGIVYFIVLTPMGLVRRWFGKSPITSVNGTPSRFELHTPEVSDGARMERQF